MLGMAKLNMSFQDKVKICLLQIYSQAIMEHIKHSVIAVGESLNFHQILPKFFFTSIIHSLLVLFNIQNLYT